MYLSKIVDFNHEISYFNTSLDRIIILSASGTDSPDPFPPLVPIVHRSRQVFLATSCISTELL